MMRFSVTFYILFLFSHLNAQEKGFVSPVNIPIELNGTFGELRRNHFHAGIDIKTNGASGLPVSSVAGGYVSRVAVSPSGYGKALYITHPNGYTSVYAHLERFSSEIEEWVREEQYRQMSYKINLYPEHWRFPVKKGEQIALSGNSGSSAGPHLHFEIRESESERPQNPLMMDYRISDTRPPVTENLFVYPLTGKSQVEGSYTKKRFPLVHYNGAYRLKGKSSVNGWGKLGFGVDAIDYLDANWSKCGIYRLEVWVDGKKIHSFRLDELDYNKMRYLNSHIDYEESVRYKRNVHKTFLDPGNRLNIYEKSRYNDGFDFDGKEPYEVKILLFDVAGNRSEVVFSIIVGTSDGSLQEKPFTKHFPYNEKNFFSQEGIRLAVPEGALYRNLNFIYEEFPGNTRIFSKIHKIHDPYTPLHLPCSLSVKTENLPEHLCKKVLIAQIDRTQGTFSPIGGSFKNGWVEGVIQNFGDFCVIADTVNPTIIPLSIKDYAILTEKQQIRFRIKDQLTGIASYTGKIDGEWVLFEYDQKNNLITYSFDDRIKKGKTHSLHLTVEDQKQNFSEYRATFYY